MKTTALLLVTCLWTSTAEARCLTPQMRPHVAQCVAFGPAQRPAFAVTVASRRGFAFLVHGPAGSDAQLRQIRVHAVDFRLELLDFGAGDARLARMRVGRLGREDRAQIE